MAYIYDDDLEFLRELSSDELNDLVDILMYDKEYNLRFTQQITSNELYQEHWGDHKQYINVIL